jgi:hypothetical protein
MDPSVCFWMSRFSYEASSPHDSDVISLFIPVVILFLIRIYIIFISISIVIVISTLILLIFLSSPSFVNSPLGFPLMGCTPLGLCYLTLDHPRLRRTRTASEGLLNTWIQVTSGDCIPGDTHGTFHLTPRPLPLRPFPGCLLRLGLTPIRLLN